jgi:hypothetical protein
MGNTLKHCWWIFQAGLMTPEGNPPKNGYFSPSWGGLFHGINGETWDVIGKNEHVISNKHMQTL